MATGAVFQIVTNDGKQDRMLMATLLLNKRLQLIQAARAADPMVQDATPTLVDIEKTHILFMNAHFRPFAAMGYEYNKVTPQSGNYLLGSDVTFSIPAFGDFFADMCAAITLNAPTFTKATGSGTQKPSGCWAAYPGLRLLQKVAFTVNGNPLDEYTQDSTAMFNQFNVRSDQRDAFNRCVGQENPNEGYLRQKDSSLTGDFSGTLPSHRIRMDVYNGAQTPKPSGSVGGLQLTIPLLFWFNLNPELMIPSVSIPYGQRFITLTLATQAQMFYLNGNGNGDGSPVYTTDISIGVVELYINNVFVNPEVHDIFIKRVGFTLIRVHREQVTPLDATYKEILLSGMKWPLEYLMIGVRRSSYQSSISDNDKWHLFNVPSSTSSYALHGVAGNDNASAILATAPSVVASVPLRMCNKMGFTAHGIPLYNYIQASFYDSYLPFTFSNRDAQHGLRTPSTIGAMLITFALHPGMYNPSGHINASRAREIYISLSSAFDTDGVTYLFSNSTIGELVVVGTAINFLLISDGSAVLRYST